MNCWTIATFDKKGGVTAAPSVADVAAKLSRKISIHQQDVVKTCHCGIAEDLVGLVGHSQRKV